MASCHGLTDCWGAEPEDVADAGEERSARAGPTESPSPGLGECPIVALRADGWRLTAGAPEDHWRRGAKHFFSEPPVGFSLHLLRPGKLWAAMGLAELMSGRPGSPSGRSERASQSRSVVSRRSSTGSVAGGVRAGLGNYEDAYISQIIANDAARQEKQEASEMRRMGTEIREVRHCLLHSPLRRRFAPPLNLVVPLAPRRCGWPRSCRRSMTRRRRGWA